MASGRVGAVIVAAGKSQRMGRMDKLWAPLPSRSGGEVPLIAQTLMPFQKSREVAEGVLVVAQHHLNRAREFILDSFGKFSVVTGGSRRQDSVLAGLKAIPDCEWVVVHDGARPLVTANLIERGLKEAAETGASLCALPVADTVKEGTSGRVIRTLDRTRLWLAQTPQTFRYELLLDAHRRTSSGVTDDAALVEALGVEVRLYEGSRTNIKVTTPDDLAIVKALLA